MRYHWLREKELQKQIKIYWQKGSENHADYYTKHFPAKYHQEIRPKYILSGHLMQQCLNAVVETTLRGCIDSRARAPHLHVSRPPQMTVYQSKIATAICSSLKNSSLINLLT